MPCSDSDWQKHTLLGFGMILVISLVQEEINDRKTTRTKKQSEERLFVNVKFSNLFNPLAVDCICLCFDMWPGITHWLFQPALSVNNANMLKSKKFTHKLPKLFSHSFCQKLPLAFIAVWPYSQWGWEVWPTHNLPVCFIPVFVPLLVPFLLPQTPDSAVPKADVVFRL